MGNGTNFRIIVLTLLDQEDVTNPSLINYKVKSGRAGVQTHKYLTLGVSEATVELEDLWSLLG